MYKKGDKVNLVTFKAIKGRKYVKVSLSRCLILTKSTAFKVRDIIAVKHQLTITDVYEHPNGKKGFVAYKAFPGRTTRFLIAHCHYPSVSKKTNADYTWTVYFIKLTSDQYAKTESELFEDVAILDKWEKEKVYISTYLKKLRKSFFS